LAEKPKPKINKFIINQVLNLTYLIINTQIAETELNCVKLHIRPFFISCIKNKQLNDNTL